MKRADGMRAAAIAASALASILAAIYADEGGYVNHPDDPGGETNMGITRAVAREEGWTGSMRYFPKQCEADTPVCADAIYERRYIRDPGFWPMLAIEPAVAKELVNTAVNMGPARPSRWFQAGLRQRCGAAIAIDGIVGPRTIAAYQACQARLGKTGSCVAVLDELDRRQRDEYDRLVRVNPKLKVFYRGWINRRIGNVDRAKCGQGV